MLRRLLPDRLKNMRDIGGVVTRSGRRLREDVFVRSNLPLGLSEADVSFLLQKRLDTAIDLRSSDEVSSQRSDLDDPRFSYHHIQVNGVAFPPSEESIPEGYVGIVDDRLTIRSIIETIARAPKGVVFHCSAGKDRSGVIAMLLLLIADAHDDDIIVDYQVSHSFFKNEIREYLAQHPGAPAWIGQSKAEYMEQTLSLFRAKYGSIGHYLNSIDLDPEDSRRLLGKMFG